MDIGAELNTIALGVPADAWDKAPPSDATLVSLWAEIQLLRGRIEKEPTVGPGDFELPGGLPCYYSDTVMHLLRTERERCAEVCEAVHIRPIQGAHEEYMAGKEMAVQQCARAIRMRVHAP